MSRFHPINIVRNISHLLAAFTTNCAHFQQEWQQYIPGIETADISGRWDGEWVSEVNGHRGQLRCIVIRLDAHHCRASFHATYWNLLRACYSVNLSVNEVNGRFKFQGEVDLGKLAGGVYQYEGEVADKEYFSTYKCQYDHGAFHLRRVD
jgi:hypothetical protein